MQESQAEILRNLNNTELNKKVYGGDSRIDSGIIDIYYSLGDANAHIQFFGLDEPMGIDGIPSWARKEYYIAELERKKEWVENSFGKPIEKNSSKGSGLILMKKILEDAKKDNVDIITLKRSISSGPKLHEYYKMIGFVDVPEEERGMYLDLRTDEPLRKISILVDNLIKNAEFKSNNLNETIENKLKGGKADKLTLGKIAEIHNIKIEKLIPQLKLGIKTEMEHTNDKKQAKEIALDHLAENPKYYTKLKKAKLEETIINSLKTSFIESENIPSKLKSDVEIEYHKSLNPKFWLNNHLKSNIRKNLLNLGKYYFKSLELDPKVELKDIIFTGSLANYNYTDSSDIDLHIVIDYKDVSDDKDFVMNYFLQKRAAWEISNDVKINNYPVEIYVQDVDEQTMGKSAMYSILNNKWVKKPKYKLPEVDKHLVTKKVNKYLDILNKISMMKDSLNKIETYNKVLKKIKKERGEAAQTEGEFSVNNLVFKVLRNKKVFDIIKDDKKEIVNNVFSIKSN